MNIPCPHHQPCCDDINSFGNYSAEDPDRYLFRSMYFANMIWDDDLDIWVACAGQCVSDVSQAAADLCAQNNAKICERNKQYGNTQHTCYRTCSDSQQYSFTIPADTFFDLSQAQANALAVNWCNNYLSQLCDHIADPSNPPPLIGFPQAKNKPDCNDLISVQTVCFEGGRGITIAPCMVWGSSKDAANTKARAIAEDFLTNNIGCLTEFGRSVCVGSPVNKWIVPNRAGAFYAPLTWAVFGAIPPGLTFTPVGIAMHITGTFTQAGTWGFQLTLTDQFGTFTYRVYIVEAMEINESATLPNGQQDEAYSHTISVNHGHDPKTFAVRSDDTLPAGLTLDGNTGVLSGIPDGPGTFTFHIVVTDFYGAVCEKEFTLLINPNSFNSMIWGLIAINYANGSSSAIAAGELGVFTAADPGGLVASGAQAGATAVWNVFNATGHPLTCSLLVEMARLNGVPPNLPPGVQWGSWGGYGWTRTDVPITICNSIGVVGEGTFGPWLFTVPPGASSWAGGFGHSVGSVNGSGPWPGGSGIMTVTFNIL